MNKDIKVKYVRPKSINKILMRLREDILELLQIKNDRGFWKDVNKEWLDTKTDYTNRSTDKEDIETNTKNDIKKVANELIQISLFGRILQTDEEGDISNYPQMYIPYFMKQSLGASYTDLYNINSQKALMKIEEKNKNLNQVRKIVSHHRHKVKRK
jgi:hypothetical protein